jgi:hypothetical protein
MFGDVFLSGLLVLWEVPEKQTQVCAHWGQRERPSAPLQVKSEAPSEPMSCSLAIVPHAAAGLDDEVEKLRRMLQKQSKG